MRRLLTGQFTTRRTKQLEPRIAQIVEDHLDAMLHAGPPADLVQSFALPITSLMICELLGVPYADRAQFQRDSTTMFSYDSTAEQAMAAHQSTMGLLAELVARTRVTPDEAIISGLIATGELTDEEIAGVSFLLLGAGYETTANTLALGTFALLSNPDQLAALRADPSLITSAVEELLRYLTITQFSVVRGTLADIELDVHRSAHGHLAFGHSIHQCLGQQLARIEMRLGYAALLRRIPTLHLAVEPQDVPMRDNAATYGVRELSITWKPQ